MSMESGWCQNPLAHVGNLFIFFFQAEDGIRDYKVTGVQTCALPISDFALLKARCYLDWLRLWLPHGTTAADWQNEREGANDLLRWRIYDPLEGVFARPNAGGKQREVVEAPALPTQVEFATLKARLT